MRHDIIWLRDGMNCRLLLLNYLYSCSNYTTCITKQNYNITFSRNNYCGDSFSTQLHPDMNPHKPELHESFVQVNVVLSLTDV